jgi:hypothetical protein
MILSNKENELIYEIYSSLRCGNFEYCFNCATKLIKKQKNEVVFLDLFESVFDELLSSSKNIQNKYLIKLLKLTIKQSEKNIQKLQQLIFLVSDENTQKILNEILISFKIKDF